jgi:LacI family transcriptional regulator
MRPSQNDIAEMAGVTQATVSYVLNGRAAELKITAPVVQRVLKAARELGYAPTHAARVLVTGKTRTLGLVLRGIGQFAAPYWTMTADGVEAAALEAGYDVLIISRQRDPEGAGLRYLRERRVDALIGFRPVPEDLELWKQEPTPPVLVHSFGAQGLPVVDLDPAPGIVRAVEHLAGLGHRTLLWLGPATVACERAEAAAGAARRHGLEFSRCELQVADGDLDAPRNPAPAGWRERIRKALPEPLPATAVLCYNDCLALGLYALLAERGLAVPRDVSVVGFDDAEAPLAVPPLSTISHQFHEIGSEATRLALRILNEEISPEEARQTRILVPAQFVPRQSSAPPPSA